MEAKAEGKDPDLQQCEGLPGICQRICAVYSRDRGNQELWRSVWLGAERCSVRKTFPRKGKAAFI